MDLGGNSVKKEHSGRELYGHAFLHSRQLFNYLREKIAKLFQDIGIASLNVFFIFPLSNTHTHIHTRSVTSRFFLRLKVSVDIKIRQILTIFLIPFFFCHSTPYGDFISLHLVQVSQPVTVHCHIRI